MFEDFNPGELNKRIQIVQLVETTEQDDWGFAPDDGQDEPVVVHECWAKVSDESGTKALENASEFSVAKRRFFIRHTATAITTEMMVKYGGSYYSIVRPPTTYGDSGRFMEIWTVKKERV